jgi:hypothetical protein
MNPQVALARVLDRIASATGAIRCQATDARRAELNGGVLGTRVEELIAQLEHVADELEAALA